MWKCKKILRMQIPGNWWSETAITEFIIIVCYKVLTVLSTMSILETIM
jgi:hypothetical protein